MTSAGSEVPEAYRMCNLTSSGTLQRGGMSRTTTKRKALASCMQRETWWLMDSQSKTCQHGTLATVDPVLIRLASIIGGFGIWNAYIGSTPGPAETEIDN